MKTKPLDRLLYCSNVRMVAMLVVVVLVLVSWCGEVAVGFQHHSCGRSFVGRATSAWSHSLRLDYARSARRHVQLAALALERLQQPTSRIDNNSDKDDMDGESRTDSNLDKYDTQGFNFNIADDELGFQGSTFKSGFVSIVGNPNVGKSTLMNALLGQKLAAVNRKPQTTQHSIDGILTEDNYQIVFTDTPGEPHAAYHYERMIMSLSCVFIGLMSRPVFKLHETMLNSVSFNIDFLKLA
jgi:hypothetical protein